MAKRPSRRSNSSASPSESARAGGATGGQRERQIAPAETASSAEQRHPQAAETLNGPPPQATSPPTTKPNSQELAKMASQNTAAGTAPQPTQAGQSQSSAEPDSKRFDIFIADIGWETPVAESLRKNLELALRFKKNSTCYVLSKDQCQELFRMHPSMIGTEPSIIIIDREARAARRSRGYGFKLNLGLIRDVPTANNLLKWVMAVLAEQKPGSDITEPIRTVIHKEGLRGAIDILADITRSPVGETATH